MRTLPAISTTLIAIVGLVGFWLWITGCERSNDTARPVAGNEEATRAADGDDARRPVGREDHPRATPRSDQPGLPVLSASRDYFKESDPLLDALVKRFDAAALRVEALKQELSKMPNADPFVAERQAKFRTMAGEMERAKADVEIIRQQVEALRVPHEAVPYHNRVLEWVRAMEDYFPAQKKFYEDSVAFWTEKRDTGAWAAYSLQLRRTDELREQLKKEIHSIDRGRRELAGRFGVPSPSAR